MPRRFKLVHDLVALMGGQLLSKVIGFAAFAYLAHVLDADAYGTVEYVVALAVVFGVFIEWGLGPIGVRALACAPEKLPSLAASILTLRLLLALVAIPPMGLCIMLLGQDAETVQLGWLFALGMLALSWKQDWLLQGLEMMTAVSAAQVIRMGVFALAVLLLVDSARDLVRVGIAEVLAAAAFATYYIVVQRFWITPIRFRFALVVFRDLLNRGLPVGSIGMIWSIMQYAPVILLAILVGGTETGWFAAAHRVVVSLVALSVVYHFNLYPAITRLVHKDPDALARLLGASFRVIAWLSLWSALVLMMLARPILVIAFGEDFAAAVPAFAVLIWVLPITLLSGHARWTLIAAGHQHCVLVAHVAALATLLVVGVALVPALEALGAALAMLVSALVVWAVAHLYAARRIGPVTRLVVAVPPAAVAAVVGVGAHLLAADPLVAAAIAAIGYVGCAPLVDRRLITDAWLLVIAKSEHPS